MGVNSYIYAFTGPRDGLTPQQRVAILVVLIGAKRLHNGSARGADQQVALVANALGVPVTAHPASGVSRYDQAIIKCDELRSPRPPLERNKIMVDESDILIAGPKEETEGSRGGPMRSGTWSTIRYARRIGKPLIIVWPDGDSHVENFREAFKHE